jgi:hypothetical protein
VELSDVKIKYHPKDWCTKKEEIEKDGRDPNPEKRLPYYESEKNPGYVDESTIEKRILRLVKAINYLGIETACCCEGHAPYPHCIKRIRSPQVSGIGRNKGLQNVGILKTFIKEYNPKNEIKWELIPTGDEGDHYNSYTLIVEHEPKNRKEMRTAQSDADRLAQYIYESEKEAQAALLEKITPTRGQKLLKFMEYAQLAQLLLA